MWITLILVALLFSGMALGFTLERRDWNKGVCQCGKGWWRSFDMDSQGGRGYHCTECRKVIWITYPFIDGKD